MEGNQDMCCEQNDKFESKNSEPFIVVVYCIIMNTEEQSSGGDNELHLNATIAF